MANPCDRTEYPLCEEKCPWFSYTKEEEDNKIVHSCPHATSEYEYDDGVAEAERRNEIALAGGDCHPEDWESMPF